MDEATDQAIDAAEMARLQAEAFAKPSPATTIRVARPVANALAKQETITRCDACGYDVTPADGHMCDRSGGRLVQVHPFACAVKDCRVARRGTVLPSLSHHAQHLQWHLDRWEKEATAAGAAALAVAASAGPPVAPTVDRWTAGVVEASAGSYAMVDLAPPDDHPRAVCVALLFHSQYLALLAAECSNVGQAPLSAYISGDRPLLAVVPIDGGAPDKGKVVIINDGAVNAPIRVGARWELPVGA